ncbi:MAG: MerR family transcriptional regulator [Myxococcales bacterium FL481]|nr:MAG: MerR family transcriptional regulator [Myxococcales bacterium FL481]
MRIGELARRVGVAASTIRYYERRGLLSAPRRVSGRREFDAQDETRLRLVAGLKAAGFTLDEVATLVQSSMAEQTPERWREVATAKLRRLDGEIERLRAAQRVLARAMQCTCEGRADACVLLRDPPSP